MNVEVSTSGGSNTSSPKLLRTSNPKTYSDISVSNVVLTGTSQSNDSKNFEILQYINSQPSSSCHVSSPSKSSDSSTRSFKRRLVEMPIAVETLPAAPSEDLKKQIAGLKKKLKNRNGIIARLKRKSKTCSKRESLKKILSNKSSPVKTFVNMQCLHKRKSAWTISEKQLALSLYYKSPGNYKYLLKKT
ncbi:uncharacterized protein LOC126883215 [Diabrotica virgifera virgifera]|uniref:Uncharacterized protein n=1 Tax=Diabrotica virgifera virgifera TaxID=50390 RepID=A0ABM5K2M0_DIAVI|nr:uncharacterized protein LOC126883215 [Diabrotica virgifera virgifera]